MKLILKNGVKVRVPSKLREELSKNYVYWLKGGEKNVICTTGEKSGKIYFFVSFSEIAAII